MICIIPQHALSVRYPRKAFQQIAGYSITEWSVIQAMCAKSVEKVYLSTESEELADLCSPLGAEIIWRPPEIQDKAFAANVPIEHALKYLGRGTKRQPFLTKLTTSPLLKPDDIDRLHNRFVTSPEPLEGVYKQCVLACRTQEGYVYRDFDIPGAKLARNVYADKSHRTVAVMGAMNILYESEYFTINRRLEWIGNGNAITDNMIDSDGIFFGIVAGNGLYYYEPCDLWQICDIDDEQAFTICKTLMEALVLKGRGPEVYYEYAESVGKKVPIPAHL